MGTKRKPTLQKMGGEALKRKIEASGMSFKEYCANLQKKGLAARKRNDRLRKAKAGK